MVYSTAKITQALYMASRMLIRVVIKMIMSAQMHTLSILANTLSRGLRRSKRVWLDRQQKRNTGMSQTHQLKLDGSARL